jgi:acyl dehydratase
MAARRIAAARLAESIGREVGVSSWIEVSQPLIDLFADATMDRQFIHIDPDRAGRTPLGGTVAHGFLVLSLLAPMSYDALPEIENAAMSLNYGMNRVRFVSPVRAGDRVRGRFVLSDVVSRAEDQLLLTHAVTVEIENRAEPALVAEWLILSLAGGLNRPPRT